MRCCSLMCAGQQFNVLKRHNIPEQRLRSFIAAVRCGRWCCWSTSEWCLESQVRRKYADGNPFHNWYHGVSVMHAVFMFLTSTVW